MKFKYLTNISLILLFFVNSFAQEHKYGFEVSMEKLNFKKSAKKIPVKVKITNQSDEILKTKNIGFIRFSFCKYADFEKNTKFDDTYKSVGKIPSKKLKANETFEFNMNLANLYWVSPMQSNLVLGGYRNFKIDVPSENVYLFTELYAVDGYKIIGENKRKSPVYKKIRLDPITVSMN